LFRQSGGSTFRVAGRHSIQVAFRISSKRTLWSNVVSCEVKGADWNSDKWLKERELLESPEARHLLRFKTPWAREHDYARFSQFAVKHASEETAAAIHYAVGKSFLHLAAHTPKLNQSREWQKRGLKQLGSVLKSTTLGPHRRRVIEVLLARKGLLRIS
jgi:hypothetical protein